MIRLTHGYIPVFLGNVHYLGMGGCVVRYVLLLCLLISPVCLADESNKEKLYASRPVNYGKLAKQDGIFIKAPDSVDEKAIDECKVIVADMLNGMRKDVRKRLLSQRATIAIVPRDKYLTALPEFSKFAGKNDPNGNPYDSFKVRGLGGVSGRALTVTSEESLLKLEKDPLAGMSVTHHEFGHMVMNVGFSDTDRKRWHAIWLAAKKKGAWDSDQGKWALKNADEYWAVLSTSYFSRNWKDLDGSDLVKQRDRAAWDVLRSIYGKVDSEGKREK